MNADDVDPRLAAASHRLTVLGARILDDGPWPLAERFDHAPEAAWGPREILAHLEEMLPYWLGEAERVVDMTSGPAPFGRVASDELRLAIIGRDRTLPMRELIARVSDGVERWRRLWAALDVSARERAGLHPALGELHVSDIATRFVAAHLDDHLDQLEATLPDVPAAV